MKRLVLIAALILASVSAFAQFPLGASKDEIKTYFGQHVSYANVQEYKTGNGGEALNFTKVRVIGDYTFYFNDQDVCTSYIETYDKNDTEDVIWRLDRKFCRLANEVWSAEDQTFNVTLITKPKKGANFISIVYKAAPAVNTTNGAVLAAN